MCFKSPMCSWCACASLWGCWQSTSANNKKLSNTLVFYRLLVTVVIVQHLPPSSFHFFFINLVVYSLHIQDLCKPLQQGRITNWAKWETASFTDPQGPQESRINCTSVGFGNLMNVLDFAPLKYNIE